MRNILRVGLVIALMAGCCGLAAEDQPNLIPVKVYKVGQNVTAPELLPANIEAQVNGSCGKRHQREMKDRITMIVDERGEPRDAYFARATGTFLDDIAMKAALASTFKPGTLNGTPVPVWGTEEFRFDVCVGREKDENGDKVETITLSAQPSRTIVWPTEGPLTAVFVDGDNLKSPVKIGGHISAPVAINAPEAHFTREARKAHYEGVCLISLLVDAHGVPQNARVVRPLGMGLDEEALKAVRRYRFRPAMKDGIQPVPVMITVQINFRLT